MKVIDVTKSLPVRRALLGLPRKDALAVTVVGDTLQGNNPVRTWCGSCSHRLFSAFKAAIA